MTTLEILYFHVLVMVASVVVWWVARATVMDVVEQINNKVINRLNEDREAQRKINIWLADKLGDVARAQQGPAKVVPFRRGPETPPNGGH